MAHGGRVDPIYTLLACIDLHSLVVEDADNGRGEKGGPFFENLVTLTAPRF